MVLFICNGNVARSQIAAELYRERTQKMVTSAGTKVKDCKSGVSLKDDGPLAENAISCIQSITGIDLSNKKRTPISEELCLKSSQIIIMADKNSLPDYIYNYYSKIAFWKIEDPKDFDFEGYKKIINQIQNNIEILAP